ncbi:Flp pilus assembly complex ATPase component TadA [Candidatus Saganbacteria bacterium]|nr:Flp pilus assembly complex ATPase component TadA [Candidatus Saganbacteria bacterium]
MSEKKKDLRTAFVKSGLLTEDQVKNAITEGRTSGESLIYVILKKKLLDEKALLKFLEDEMDIPHVNLSTYLIDQKIIESIPPQTAKKYSVIPLFVVENSLSIAMVDPFNIKAIDEIRQKTGLDVQVMAAMPSEINSAISQYYGVAGSLEEVLSEVGKPEASGAVQSITLTEEAPIAKLVSLLLAQAIEERASDIHIDPEENRVRVRYRIDGVLHESSSPPAHLHSSIASRIKVMSGLDIAETRIPQDGRLSFDVSGREVDVRVSTYPTIYGEAVVMRLLDKKSAMLSLSDIGFSQEYLKKFEAIVRRPYGIILVTGPTGSGKTTTLYSTLNHINSPELNIMTIEDPVEYELAGIRQAQVNVKAGMIFSNALRSMLRQDPDVILVGEIRDFETARVAIEAALTGHLVFSTLHTNDAAGSLTRLTDMGVEPFLTSSATAAVLAQRLVRKICSNCKVEIKLPQAELKEFEAIKIKNPVFYHGKGCKSCHETGYLGRTSIFEIMEMSEEIRELVVARESTSKIKDAAIKSGMKTLREDGLLKVAQGVTTLDEVLRVTQLD